MAQEPRFAKNCKSKSCGRPFRSNSRGTRFCSSTCQKANAKAVAKNRLKRQKEKAKYHANLTFFRDKARLHAAHRRSHKIAEPTMTCVAKSDPAHQCSGATECHHKDGNWRNGNHTNLEWRCRKAHEAADQALAI